MLEMPGGRKRSRTGAEHEHSIKLSHGAYSVSGKRSDKYSSLSSGSTNLAETGARGNFVPRHDRGAPWQPALNPQSGPGRCGREYNGPDYRRDRHRQGSHRAGDSRTQPPAKPKSGEGE